jgi:hypothetical protein
MRCRLNCVLWLATCLTALPALSAKPYADDSVTVAADNDAKARGIHAFAILASGTSTPVARILDESGNERATVHFDRTRPYAMRADYSSGSAAFRFFFNMKAPRVEIVLADGRRATWIVEDRRWVGTDGAADVLVVAGVGIEEIALAANALPPDASAPEPSRNPLAYAPDVPPSTSAPGTSRRPLTPGIFHPSPPPPPGPGAGGCTSDGGNSKDGWAAGFTRAQACNSALQSANNQCSNLVCWGCCQVDPCSVLGCLQGDFVCTALVQGYPCNY